jgi:arginine decarboxylase
VPLDQSDTPYVDAMLAYRARGFAAFHTPGHKLGAGAPEKLRRLMGAPALGVDVAMAGGVEDTRESTQLIRLAEEYAAEAWGADRCHFLVNGSTSGVHALILTLAGPGDDLIVPRNAHKSLQAALIFSGAMPHYLVPRVDGDWGIPTSIPVGEADRALAACPQARALVVTSPTYNGLAADLSGLAALTHAAGLPFIVDQAWGPHLRFCGALPVDAMTAGADACVVSTHKLLSGITQSAILLAKGDRLNLARLETMVKMTQSTSPQTLMYGSIDAARQQMATEGEALWSRAAELADWARDRINGLPGLRCLGREALEWDGVAAFDPTRLTVSALRLGQSGYELETILRDDHGIAVEAAGPISVILNVTHGDTREDVSRLVEALGDYAARHAGVQGAEEAAARWLRLRPPAFTRQAMTPRDAFFAASVPLPLEDCAGRVSAELITPYPPGIPVLGPGEEVSDEIVAYLQEAGAVRLKVHGAEDSSLQTLRVVL